MVCYSFTLPLHSASPSSIAIFASLPTIGNIFGYNGAFSELACLLAYRAAIPCTITARRKSIQLRAKTISGIG